jgi:membrane protease YdiL (CAAX protease family)
MKILHMGFSEEKVAHSFLFLILCLLIPFHLLVFFVYHSFPDWATQTVELGTYILLSALVLIRRSTLQDYQIDKTALWILILSGTLFRVGPFSIINITYWLIGVLLIAVYFRGYFSFKPQASRVGWFFVSIFSGIGLPVILFLILNLPNIINIPNWFILFSQKHPWPSFSFVLNNLAYNIFYVAVIEELVYRGFLWGCLEKKGWGWIKILFFQSGLFWAGHLFYLDSNPFTLWFAIPMMGLAFGFVARRSRSVTLSILMHGISNAVLAII